MRGLLFVALILLGGCASKPQIQCHNEEGEITYIGPYDEERRGAYIVHINESMEDYHSKNLCAKILVEAEKP